MNKADLAILGKAFARETQGLLFQSKSKRVKRLAEQGYLSHRSWDESFIGGLRVSFECYELTHLGRLTYCTTCTEETP